MHRTAARTRVRLRPLSAFDPVEVRKDVISEGVIFTMPSLQEQLTIIAKHHETEARITWEDGSHGPKPRILHLQHRFGEPCTPRCAVADAVPEDLPVGPDEFQVG